MNVATSADVAALAKRIAALEAQAQRNSPAWMRLSKSPLGARKLRRLISAGKIEASKVGRLLFVRIDDHNRFLEARIIKPSPKPVAVPEGASVAEFCEANLHLLRRTG